MSPGDGDRLDALEKKIGKVPRIFRDLKETNPELYNSVMGLDHMVWADGCLTRKQKKLIAVAIAAAMRDGHAVRAQLAGAPSTETGCAARSANPRPTPSSCACAAGSWQENASTTARARPATMARPRPATPAPARPNRDVAGPGGQFLTLGS